MRIEEDEEDEEMRRRSRRRTIMDEVKKELIRKEGELEGERSRKRKRIWAEAEITTRHLK